MHIQLRKTFLKSLALSITNVAMLEKEDRAVKEMTTPNGTDGGRALTADRINPYLHVPVEDA